jgi:hypothetical protein
MKEGSRVSEKKGLGEKVLGWFVERDDATGKAPPDAEEPAPAEPSGEGKPSPAPPAPIALGGELLPADGAAELNFAAVFRAAGVSDEAQDRVEKAVALLANLPAETPREVKRQIVEASLKAFGYPVEEIVQAGSSELHALGAFVEFGARNTQKAVAEASERIEALSREIAEVKTAIEHKLAAQQKLAGECDQRKLRVGEVLDFFGSGTTKQA